MKNEVFSFRRFGKYFKYDATQMWRNHVKAAFVIGLFGLFSYFVYNFFHLLFAGAWEGPSLPFRFIMFVGAFTALELFQTRTYGFITERKQGSAWLLVPASAFEKWLSMILMTLFVIPLAFLLVYFGVDALITLLDPTVAQSMVSSLWSGIGAASGAMPDYNELYEVNWGANLFLPAIFLSFCCNFLYFLLCGVVFRRLKILFGFLILLGISMLGSVASLILTLSSLSGDVQVENLDMVSTVFHGFNWVLAVVAVILAGLIYRRIKTIKH